MLVAENKEMMLEWDWAKNTELGLDPQIITTGSNQKVWWVCPAGHEWSCSVIHRRNGQTCPYCSGRKLLCGYNDLATKNPELLRDWDYEGNGNLIPDAIVYRSRQKVAWKCSACGHKWEISPYYRTVRGTGCPVCSKQKNQTNRIQAYIRKNGSIAETNLVRQWNYHKNGALDPHDFTPQSNQSVWWLCDVCGYEWKSKINNRTNGRGCPCCSNRRTVPGVNDLATTNPLLASQWHPTKNGDLTPQKVTAGSGKKVWWLCPNGHEFKATILHRTYGTNCPICNSGRQTSFAEQAVYFYVKQIFPSAISRCSTVIGDRMELDIYIPEIKLAIEYDGSFWHKPEKLARERRKYNACHDKGIRLIRIKEVIPEDSFDAMGIADEIYSMDHLENRKNLERQIQYLLDRIDPYSNMWTRKDPNHVFSDVRVDLDRDRFEILQYMQIRAEDSLKCLYPSIASEWHPDKNGTLTPNLFTPGSSEKIWWKCSVCGHEWCTSINHRVNGTGCPKCYDRNRSINHPEAIKVYQYTLDGEYIREWSSVAEAGRCLSINSSNISMCIHHRRNQAGGFRWEVYQTEQLSEQHDQLSFW